MQRQPGRITAQLHHVPKEESRRPVDPVAISADLAQSHAGKNVSFNIRPRRIDLGGLEEETDLFFTLDVHEPGTNLLAEEILDASAITSNLEAPLPTTPFHSDPVTFKQPKQWDDKSEK